MNFGISYYLTRPRDGYRLIANKASMKFKGEQIMRVCRAFENKE